MPFETIDGFAVKSIEDPKKKTKKNETGFGPNPFKDYVKLLIERRVDDILNKIVLEIMNDG